MVRGGSSPLGRIAKPRVVGLSAVPGASTTLPAQFLLLIVVTRSRAGQSPVTQVPQVADQQRKRGCAEHGGQDDARNVEGRYRSSAAIRTDAPGFPLGLDMANAVSHT